MSDLKPDIKKANTMDEQTETANSPTPETPGQTKTKKSPTAKKPSQTKAAKSPAPAKADAEPPKWTVRGVDTETRAILSKAADKAGQSLGEYFNSALREFATGQIKREPPKPPASPTDIKGMIAAEMATQSETMIVRILEALKDNQAKEPEQRKPFFQRLKDLF